MKDSAVNAALTDDSWVEVTYPSGCVGYAIQALQPGKSFQQKRLTDDTAVWTVFPKIHEKTGQEMRARVVYSNPEGYSGSFFIRSRNFPIDLEINFY